MADGQRRRGGKRAPWSSGATDDHNAVNSLIGAARRVSRLTPDLRPLMLGINLLALVSCAIQLMIPFLFGKSFSGLFSAVHSSTWARNIYLLLACGVASALLSGVESRLALRLRHRSVMRLEASACEALFDKPVLAVKAREAGELASHLSADVLAAADLIGLQASFARISTLTLGSLGIVAIISPPVAAAVFLVALIYYLIILRVTPRVADAYRTASNETARSSSYFYQLIGAVLDIRVFGSRGFFAQTFANKASLKADAMISAGRLSKRLDQSSYVVQLSGSFVILAAATKYSGTGRLDMSGVLASMGVLAFFWSSLRSGMTQWLNVRKNLPLVYRLQAWLDRTPLDAAAAFENMDAPISSSAISFRNVSFRFPDVEQDVFTNLNFDIAHGERILLTGANGVGKTTLMYLMLGLIQPSSGCVMIDGSLCSKLEDVALRRLIVRVAHDGYLFPGSVKENVAFGRAETLTVASMSSAMELSGCIALVATSGLAATSGIGEQGGRLSAGQRQRVLIARALAGEAKILLLDEATASIDADSTFEIYKKLLLKSEGLRKTVIVTAHHFDFLTPMVDRHFHLADGALREEVIAASPPFRAAATEA